MDRASGGDIGRRRVLRRRNGGRALVLRFPLVATVPATSPWTSTLWTGFDATELAWEVSTGGCVDTPGNRETCQAPASHKSGTVTFGEAGPTGFRRDPQARGGLHFYPVKPELYFSVLPREIHDAVTAPLTCTDVAEERKVEGDLVGRPLRRGHPAPGPAVHALNPFVTCVQHDGVADAELPVSCIRRPTATPSSPSPDTPFSPTPDGARTFRAWR